LKKRYFSFVALTLVLMLILATGCGVRINGKDYELFTVSQNDKNNIFNGVGVESSSNQEFSEEKQNGEQLNVSSNAGNVSINKSETSQIKIIAEKKVRGASSDNKKNILDNMNVTIERDGKVINVVVKTKDGNDFWKWQKDSFKAFQVSLNLKISLPEGINEIKASTGAGNIDVNDVTSKLTLSTGAGNIDVQEVSARGDISLSTGAGNIHFEGNVEGISSFNSSTGVGNVDFEAPKDSKMLLKADTGIGILSGSFVKSKENNKFHFAGDVNGGGPTVKLNTGVGNVKADEN